VSLVEWYLQRYVSVGWCLLVSVSIEDIGVSSRLVPTSFVTIGWCLQTFIRVMFCGFLLQGFLR